MWLCNCFLCFNVNKTTLYEYMIDHRSYAHNFVKLRPEKAFGPERDSTPNFTTAYVACMTVMIYHIFISFSTVQI